METYKRTHPWLTFGANLKKASNSLWIMLGECQSKCAHISKVPLRPDTAKQLYQVYLAKGALGTTAIEGNTLSEPEVIRLLDDTLKLPPSREYLAREVTNIVDGCNAMLEAIASGRLPTVSLETITDLNRTVLKDLALDEGCTPGELRTRSVVVGRYRGAPARDCRLLLNRLCEWLNGEDFNASDDMGMVVAILKATIAHLYIAWIHPFADGNGRTARLLEFQILISAGVPAVSAHLLSNHYNLTRTEYYRQLGKASKTGGDIVPFLQYAVRGFLDGLMEQIEVIWGQQWDIAWRNYVYELFRSKSSSTQTRRRNLVLDLSRESEPVRLANIGDLSPRLAKAYAGRTTKTLMRDLSSVCRLGLVARSPKGYKARKEIILTFLPPKVGENAGNDNGANA